MIENNYKWGRAELSETLKLLIPKISLFLRKFDQNKKLKVLDLGCGTGYLTNYLREQDYLIVGSEVQEGYTQQKKLQILNFKLHSAYLFKKKIF